MDTSAPYRLLPCPRGFRTLTNEESERLNRGGNKRYTVDYCVTCRGDKNFWWWSDETRTEIVEWECDCVEQYLMHRYFLWSGVLTRYQRLSWADLRDETKEAQEIVRGYLDNADDEVNRGTGLIFYGPAGTGKTLLSQLALKQLLANGYDGYSTTFNALIEMFTAGWKSTEEQEWFHRRVRNSTVLVVDDIGKEGRISTAGAPDSNSLVERIIDEVLRWRVANAMPTIITTNGDPYDEKFALRYGIGVMDLLCESASSYGFQGITFRPDSEQRNGEERDAGLKRPVVVG